MRLRIRALAFLAAALTVLGMGGARASSPTGQSYELFSKYYKEGITFINQNDGRHLIPLALAKGSPGDGNPRITYFLIGDTLNALLTMDAAGQVIESCIITLTAPAGMEYGNAIYHDFAISGYQSYALLMAMHADPDPARRYKLVTDVEAGMAASSGSYQRQVGVYTLTCTRENSAVALRFEIKALQETPEPEPLGPEEDVFPVEPEEEESGML